jgi:uncharacterized protein YjiS (DUF1127 family)
VAGGDSFWPHFHFIQTKRKIIQMTHILKAAAKWVSSYSLYMTTIAELNALTDRELKDLGMTREQIIFEAAKHFARA